MDLAPLEFSSEDGDSKVDITCRKKAVYHAKVLKIDPHLNYPFSNLNEEQKDKILKSFCNIDWKGFEQFLKDFIGSLPPTKKTKVTLAQDLLAILLYLKQRKELKKNIAVMRGISPQALDTKFRDLFPTLNKFFRKQYIKKNAFSTRTLDAIDKFPDCHGIVVIYQEHFLIPNSFSLGLINQMNLNTMGHHAFLTYLLILNKNSECIYYEKLTGNDWNEQLTNIAQSTANNAFKSVLNTVNTLHHYKFLASDSFLPLLPLCPNLKCRMALPYPVFFPSNRFINMFNDCHQIVSNEISRKFFAVLHFFHRCWDQDSFRFNHMTFREQILTTLFGLSTYYIANNLVHLSQTDYLPITDHWIKAHDPTSQWDILHPRIFLSSTFDPKILNMSLGDLLNLSLYHQSQENSSQSESEDQNPRQANLESQTEFENQSQTEFENQSQTEFENQSQTEFENQSQTEFESQSQTEFENQSQTDFENQSQTDTECQNHESEYSESESLSDTSTEDDLSPGSPTNLNNLTAYGLKIPKETETRRGNNLIYDHAVQVSMGKQESGHPSQNPVNPENLQAKLDEMSKIQNPETVAKSSKRKVQKQNANIESRKMMEVQQESSD